MIRFAAVVWLAFAGPGLATVDSWPALYDVASVEPGDRLNIRSGPGTGHDVIGTLAHDASAVEVTGVNEDESWGRVNTGEMSGWVSMSFMDRRPGQSSNAPPKVVQCFGTEPFWSLARIDETLEYSSPDEAWSLPLTSVTSSRNLLNRHAFTADGVTLIVTSASCSDQMSDRHFGLSADLVIRDASDTVMLSGCCTLGAR